MLSSPSPPLPCARTCSRFGRYEVVSAREDAVLLDFELTFFQPARDGGDDDADGDDEEGLPEPRVVKRKKRLRENGPKMLVYETEHDLNVECELNWAWTKLREED